MIVKNESRIIIRLLETILPIIDYYVICDTGSTDGTPAIIVDFFQDAKIDGVLFHEPFVNFEHNRNIALNACLSAPADYILLLDADMRLVVGWYDKEFLGHADVYNIFQGNDSLLYNNVRIVRNIEGFAYTGATHEYMNIPSRAVKCTIPRDILFIDDVGDGGSKEDKFARDINLLERSLTTDPCNGRTHFYLANSYKNTGNFAAALRHYKRRIELGGWIEEIFMSYLEMGACYHELSNDIAAVNSWLQGYQAHPKRAETLYEIVKHYRWNSKNHLAALFAREAERVVARSDVDTGNFLFLNPAVYTYLLDVEKLIYSMYVGDKGPLDAAVLNVLARGDWSSICNVMSNFKFYKYIPEYREEATFTRRAGDSLISSSMSLLRRHDGYLINQRFVNYYILPDGSYVLYKDKQSPIECIRTINRSITVDFNFKITSLNEFENHLGPPRRYEGIEDVKIFSSGGKIYFIGTGYRKDERLGISYGEYKPRAGNLISTDIVPEWNQNSPCEKNWVFAELDGRLVVIYQWHPLIVGEIKGDVLVKLSEAPTPAYLRHARGSSCGSKLGSEWYFVVHFVSYESPRHYYHAIVVLDERLNFKTIGRIFSFEGEPIEYCLGIVVDEDTFTLSYSTWDRTSKIRVYDKSNLLN